jgi:hypothetical protein
MPALPARNIFDGTAVPATSTMKSTLGTLRDFLAALLGTTGTAVDARTALGAAESGACASITSLTALASINGGPLSGTRNRLINGNMSVDQRNGGAAVTVGAASSFAVDRWAAYKGTAGATVTAQQVNASLAGFDKAVALTNSVGAAPGIAELNVISQAIEGYNVSDFQWGTANAKPVALSFCCWYVLCSIVE